MNAQRLRNRIAAATLAWADMERAGFSAGQLAHQLERIRKLCDEYERTNKREAS